jgi:hypothetical protein
MEARGAFSRAASPLPVNVDGTARSGQDSLISTHDLVGSPDRGNLADHADDAADEKRAGSLARPGPQAHPVKKGDPTMSQSAPGCEVDSSSTPSTPSTAQDREVDSSSTPSTKRVNWEIGGDEIVKVIVHAAKLGQKPGKIITDLIKTHLNDFSVVDQRKSRATRARNLAAKSTPNGSANHNGHASNSANAAA